MNEYPVCLNPSCKSYGSSHPNCKCHGGMAEGGEVESYCSSHKLHNEKCKYYADGGEVNPPGMDPDLATASHLSGGGLHDILKMNLDGPAETIQKYNKIIKRGDKHIKQGVNNLFTSDKSEKIDHSKSRKFIDEWIDKGGITNDLQQEMYKQNAPQQFAEGGKVHKHETVIHNDHIADAYPTQNVLLQAAKSRLSNYLTGLKPQKNQPKLAFDDEPDQRQQKKSYDRALKIAADPTRILHKIKDGTIEPEHVQHFKAMYPDVDSILQKKITEKITDAQMKGEKPSYKVRQGMSMYLGTPLSSEMTPQNIMAAQSVFQSKKQDQSQQMQKAPSASSTKGLTKADDSFLTGNQSRVARSQKQ